MATMLTLFSGFAAIIVIGTLLVAIHDTLELAVARGRERRTHPAIGRRSGQNVRRAAPLLRTKAVERLSLR